MVDPMNDLVNDLERRIKRLENYITITDEMVEAAAKAIFWNQMNIMHDHEKEWAGTLTKHLWLESARHALEAALSVKVINEKSKH